MMTKPLASRYSAIMLLFLVFAALSSCRKDMPEAERIDFRFFPLQIGDYRIYDVTEIKYAIWGEVDTSLFQLKEVVADSFLNEHGETTYLVNRFSRQNDEEVWAFDSVWTARRNDTEAIYVENNVPFIKLVFPVEENKKWDGNAANALDTMPYQMVSLFAPYEVKGNTYTKTLTVIQNNITDTIVTKDIRTEIYALDIGLIHKNLTHLNFCTDPECLGEQEIETGRILIQNLIAYGNE